MFLISSSYFLLISSFLSIGVIFVTTKFPLVKVPVLSNAIYFIFDNHSTTSPPYISIPYLDALPIPAIIAVGVASTKAHGQNTTNIVTDLNI